MAKYSVMWNPSFFLSFVVDDDDIITIPGASDLLPLTADEESLLSKYRRLDDRRQYAVHGYTDSKLEEQERETGELYEEHIKEA